ncbi:TonB-dependent receptor plug domain-containing protein [Geminocystis sp. GBBB08]|uniref:TonB-dependent receptor plug domain-containing protein n=1 Tax=Geminocystis sp. GBBB08 TaxID=2604140 RepID=UPI0027E2B958|nr:TonB-dependent receptor plug domain-containing protein [Geminocystis sp. GBBB08]
MKLDQFSQHFLLSGLMMAFMATPAQSEELENKVLRLSDIEAISQKAELLLSQNLTQIRGIRVESSEKGLQIILETDTPTSLQPLIYTQENTLVIDVLDAVLTEEFRVENPSNNITEIRATSLDSDAIRITVTSKTGIPTAQVIPSEINLVLGLTAGDTATSQTQIEIIATQEAQQSRGYFVPNASTGTRTDTPIIETPFSVQVVPQQVIRSQQATNIQEVLQNVSSVVSQSTSQGRSANFNIRGFGNPLGTSVPVLRDGYRVYGSFDPIPEVANLEQVEVLKGPSSILYGQIQPGGMINLVSKKPLNEPFAEIELQLGNYGLVRPRFDLSGPLSRDGQFLYRLNGLYKHEWSF